MTPPKRPTPPPPKLSTAASRVKFSPVGKSKGQRVVLYGTGGVGKSTLACLAPGPVAFLDAEESLPILKTQLESSGITLPTIVTVDKWSAVMDALKSEGWDDIKTIAIDTETKLEEWAVAHTLKTVKNDADRFVQSVEGYGYGKGFQFVFDTFLPLLGELDRHVRAGRNVILIAHECTSNVPNPRGEDWLRYEPRLQNPSSGKASIRARTKEWADHVLFLCYDVEVEKKTGVAAGTGTRTLYTAELPFCMAKSRTTTDSFSIEHGVSPWEEIIK